MDFCYDESADIAQTYFSTFRTPSFQAKVVFHHFFLEKLANVMINSLSEFLRIQSDFYHIKIGKFSHQFISSHSHLEEVGKKVKTSKLENLKR